MTILQAPWSDTLVAQLQAIQDGKAIAHPYTCPSRGDGKHRKTSVDLGLLTPTPDGWVCPDCGYTQDWAVSPGVQVDPNVLAVTLLMSSGRENHDEGNEPPTELDTSDPDERLKFWDAIGKGIVEVGAQEDDAAIVERGAAVMRFMDTMKQRYEDNLAAGADKSSALDQAFDSMKAESGMSNATK